MRACFWSFLLACLVLLDSPLTGEAQAAMVDCHGQMGMAVAAPQVTAVQPALAIHHDEKAGKCHLCSLCCVGALINTVQASPAAQLPSGNVFPDPRSANPAPTLAGLDRPPRPLAL